MLSLLRELHAAALDLHLEDRHQFRSRIVFNVDEGLEATSEARVGSVDELIHLLSVARHDDDELPGILDHACHQCSHGFLARLVVLPGIINLHEHISLINEEYSSHGFVASFVNLLSCVVHETALEVLRLLLDHLVCRQQSYCLEYLSEHLCHSGLARAGIACQHDVVRCILGVHESSFHAHLIHLHTSGHLPDGVLDLLHPDE